MATRARSAKTQRQRLSPFAFRLSPFAFRLSPFAFRLSPFATIPRTTQRNDGMASSRRPRHAPPCPSPRVPFGRPSRHARRNGSCARRCATRALTPPAPPASAAHQAAATRTSRAAGARTRRAVNAPCDTSRAERPAPPRYPLRSTRNKNGKRTCSACRFLHHRAFDRSIDQPHDGARRGAPSRPAPRPATAAPRNTARPPRSRRASSAARRCASAR
ncbi:hypothetical protein DP56_3168 [Burkholderia pseudomallei]|nr:hypothetical protein DP56_3168 [Burkholderia pseudomallei]